MAKKPKQQPRFHIRYEGMTAHIEAEILIDGLWRVNLQSFDRNENRFATKALEILEANKDQLLELSEVVQQSEERKTT